jgi:hypothetical protein
MSTLSELRAKKSALSSWLVAARESEITAVAIILRNRFVGHLKSDSSLSRSGGYYRAIQSVLIASTLTHQFRQLGEVRRAPAHYPLLGGKPSL